MSLSSSSTSRSGTSTTMGLSAAVLAVVAASAVSYYYRASDKNSTATTTSREIISDENSSSGTATNDRLDRWDKRWSTGKTGWHKTDVHATLQQYCDTHLLENIIGGGARILVPLCGKTVDMAFLAQKRPISDVVGIDGIPQAIVDFVKEQPDLNIQAEEPIKGFMKYKGNSISLFVGDFFDVTVEVVGGTVDAVWDRGSLVAIEPSLRDQYLDKIGELIVKPNGRYLLSTYVRPNNDTTSGPPFSIDETEVRRLFGSKTWVNSVELLDTQSALSLEPWYTAALQYYRLRNVQQQTFIISTK
jgi:thiopurine S-methyltransferase